LRHIYLTVAEGDWSGKLIKVNVGWTLPASDYDFYIHKGSVAGPEVARSGEAPRLLTKTLQSIQAQPEQELTLSASCIGLLPAPPINIAERQR
jgi:hypothetical protein